MKVLFWLKSFPEVSETFIRNQIFDLMDQQIYVEIFTRRRKLESKALEGFEDYNIMNRVFTDSEIMPSDKFKKLISALLILFKNITNSYFKYLISSLNIFKYGNKAKRLEHFFFLNFLITHKIEIIHMHFGDFAKNAVFIKKINFPIKLLVTFHGYDTRQLLSGREEEFKSLFQYVDGVFSISSFNRKVLEGAGLEKSKIFDLNNAVNIGFFNTKRISHSENIKILTVARLVEDKSLHLALMAIRKLIDSNKNLKISYKIIGEGDKYNELISLANKLNLLDIVDFLGSRSTQEVKEYMHKSDFFLLTSKNEALPTVLLEAFSCGLPAICTKVGGVSDILIDGYNGYLCESNTDSLYSSLQKMIDNIDKLEIFSRNARKLIEENFSTKIVTQKLINYYKSI
jgi:colanic acid/amylovoran biosynthesis glycosyltransferase